MKEIKKKYPNGSKMQNWTLFYEVQKGVKKPVIRRWVQLPDGKKVFERYPAKLFKGVATNHDELEKLVIRLNGAIPEEYRRQKKIELKHAYISPKMLDEYLDILRSRIPNKGGVSKEFMYLQKYFLNFFINKMDMANPLEWHQSQHMWSWALLNEFPENKKNLAKKLSLWPEKRSPSDKTLKEIIQAANRFMEWLHQKRPAEAKPLEFAPLTRAVLKNHAENRSRLGIVEEGQYVTDTDWATIRKNLPLELKPFVLLGYFYGMRRSETLGVVIEGVMEDHYHLTQQIDGIQKGSEHIGSPIGKPRYRNLKGRKARKISHWFASPDECYEWIELIFDKKLLCHQDTLSDRWAEFIVSLDMDYDFHDLRHTFVTKAVMKYPVAEVMLCAGHENIETTMGYFHDAREMSNKRFVPKKKSA